MSVFFGLGEAVFGREFSFKRAYSRLCCAILTIAIVVNGSIKFGRSH